jgi:hypothetical protein
MLMQSVATAVLGMMVVAFVGCNDDKGQSAEPSSGPPVAPAKPPRDEVKEATDSFPEFCRKTIGEQQAYFKGRKFSEPVRSFTMTYEVTISDRFTYDVKKSDSLISPLVGELWIEGRADGEMASLPVTGKWVKQKIECSYRNGKWQHDTNVEGMFRSQ